MNTDIEAMERLLRNLKADAHQVIEDLPAYVEAQISQLEMSNETQQLLRSFAQQFASVRTIWRRGMLATQVQVWLNRNNPTNPSA